MTTLRADVAIAGAGLAGLGLALDLAQRGRRVILLERRRQPGGAVFSLPGADGADNSIHLFLAAFTRCRARLAQLGSRPLRELDDTCHVALDGHRFRLPLGAGRLPTLAGLVRLRHPLGSGLELATGLARLGISRPRPGETAGAWLERRGLPRRRLAGLFWREWGLSVFNAPLELVDAGLFRRTLLSLFRDPRSHRPLLADCPLVDLWVKPFEQALERAGVRLLTGTALHGVARDAGGIRALLAEGLRVEAPQVVWAGPPEGLAQVEGLADCRPALPPRREGRHIVNLRLPCVPGLRLDRLTGWFGQPFQWVFAGGDGWLTLVGSGWTDADLAQRAELLPRLPGWLAAHGLTAGGPPRWIVQRHATALQSPDFEAARPPARPLDQAAPGNLYFCGAWLDTGLPLSMESALASAELTLQALQFD
ncbi:MAG: FAD-dependent oxidoreductase [Candidatus Delongbacteria bacterium]